MLPDRQWRGILQMRPPDLTTSFHSFAFAAIAIASASACGSRCSSNSSTAAAGPLGDAFPAVRGVLRKGMTLRGYTLFEVVGNPERMAKGKQYVLDGLASGKLKPVIAKFFPFKRSSMRTGSWRATSKSVRSSSLWT